MMRKGDWSGGYTHGEQDTYPYKVESGQTQDIHEGRERSVHEGEKEHEDW